jgi:hypothetical protein
MHNIDTYTASGLHPLINDLLSAVDWLEQDASGGLLIVDRVLIPDDIAPGEYVLGWRWVRLQRKRKNASSAMPSVDVL